MQTTSLVRDGRGEEKWLRIQKPKEISIGGGEIESNYGWRRKKEAGWGQGKTNSSQAEKEKTERTTRVGMQCVHVFSFTSMFVVVQCTHMVKFVHPL